MLPEHASPKGFCMTCDKDAQQAVAASLMVTGIPKKGFKAAIDEIRRTGRPMQADLAESTLSNLGGVEELGRRIAEDIKEMRGEGLEPAQQMHHPKDEYYGHIRGLYATLITLMGNRDEMVGAADPFEGVSEEDMMAVASQAAMLRLENDADFRKEMLRSLTRLDPEAVIDAAGEAIDLIDSKAGVIVVGERHG
jgi:hypothetical protein